MFQQKVNSLDQLDEYEFEALLSAAYSSSWDEYEELYEEAPQQWVQEWIKHLEIGEIYSLSDLDPIWTRLNWIGDTRSHQYWTYVEHSDGTYLGYRVNKKDEKLSKEILWPLVKDDLKSIGNSILYGTFDINSEWVPKSAISKFLLELMKDTEIKHLKGGTGPTLEAWLAEQYS